jgi:hypothetical protein
MKRMIKMKLAAIFTGALTMLAAPAAFAAEGLGSPTGGYGTAGLLIGAATQDYMTFGIGARGGYTLPNTPVYIGGTLAYHFGADHVHTFLFGVEGGYDLPVGPVVIRPYLGLGDSLISFSGVTIPGVGSVGGTSKSYFAFWPGGTVMYPINQFFVGGDMRLYVVPGIPSGGDAVGLGIYATGGLQF